MVRSAARACGVLGLVLAAGCGGKPAPVPVSGVVTLDGRPAVGAVVLFLATENARQNATGTVGPDGAFRLTTEAPGDGAYPGQYKVVIQPPSEGGATPFDDPGKPAARPKAPRGPGVPERYTRVDQTPLTQDVPPTGNVVFDLKSR